MKNSQEPEPKPTTGFYETVHITVHTCTVMTMLCINITLQMCADAVYWRKEVEYNQCVNQMISPVYLAIASLHQAHAPISSFPDFNSLQAARCD